MLKRMIATSPDLQVVGTARDGHEALARFEAAQPDVICTDYLMPGLDGLGLIERAMSEFPRPILVISSTVDPSQRDRAFPLLAAGAIDVFAKPDARAPFEQSAAELVQKIKLLSGIVVIARRAPVSIPAPPMPREASAPPAVSNALAASLTPVVAAPLALKNRASPLVRIIAVGASTGGPQVLQTLFSLLPRDFGCPILCVQHISAGFLEGLVQWLGTQCHVRVKIAEPGETATAGTVYFPPENTHLEVDGRGRLSGSTAPSVDGHRPSVTVTFESVARHYGRGALGVLLTGMGADGAAGLEAIARAGGTTMAQNEASCVVFGMPKQAILRGAAQFILPPPEIAATLLRLTAYAVR